LAHDNLYTDRTIYGAEGILYPMRPRQRR
jgi:hypothetical protein